MISIYRVTIQKCSGKLLNPDCQSIFLTAVVNVRKSKLKGRLLIIDLSLKSRGLAGTLQLSIL